MEHPGRAFKKMEPGRITETGKEEVHEKFKTQKESFTLTTLFIKKQPIQHRF